MSRFIILLNKGSKEQKDAITKHLMAKPWGVWHHFEDSWMVTSTGPNVTAKTIMEEISALPVVGTQRKLILKIPDGHASYWGNGPEASWKWIKDHIGNP